MRFTPSRWISRYRGRNGTEYKMQCPKCLHNNLWWNDDRQAGRCFSCPGQPGFGARGMARMFRSSVKAGLPVELPKPKERQPSIVYPYQDYWSARWHLEDYRKCTPEQVKDFTYDETRERIRAPLFRIDQQPTDAWMSRHVDPDCKGWRVEPKGTTRAEHWFLRREQMNLETVILVEGIFDVITPALERWAVATLGTKITDAMQDWFWEHGDRIKNLVVWYDPDVPGVKGAKDAIVILKGPVKNVVVITDQPEPGDLTPQAAREVLRSAEIPIHV